nr:uncharacterized protein LOC117850480 [Setaria viridis]
MQDVILSLTDVVVPAPEQQISEEVAVTTSGTVATLVAPEPEAEIETVTVLGIMAADASTELGSSTSLAMVPLSTTDFEAHVDPLAAREISLEDIQLIDDPLLNMDMVAGMMEMHRRIAYAEDVIKCSHRKSQMLQGYGDSVLHAEALEKELAKEREYSSRLLMKYDGAAAEYRSRIQQLEEEKDRLKGRNKSLN